MSLIAKDNGSMREPIPEGAYTAVCTGIIDLGQQYSEQYGKSSPKVMLQWEIIGETYEVDGEVRTRLLSREYTNSLSEKARLRNDLEAWRGKKFTAEELKGFSLVKLLGKACQVQIVHNETPKGKYENIKAIMGIPKGMEPPKIPSDRCVVFDMDSPDETVYESLPEWIRLKIDQAEERKPSGTVDLEFEEIEDDGQLPF